MYYSKYVCTVYSLRGGAAVSWQRDGPGFDSRWGRCIYQASRPSQGTVNGAVVSK